jgi:hypothetical protein
LATEVEYAILEKREKGDNFAIIVLCFSDESGRPVNPPELLRQYVWSKPESELEALWAIIKGLPLKLGVPEWKDITTPKKK